MNTLENSFLTDIWNYFSKSDDVQDTVKNSVKLLDLSKTEDLQKYISTCDELKANKTFKDLYGLFGDETDWDSLCDNLKTAGYKEAAELKAKQQKTEKKESEDEKKEEAEVEPMLAQNSAEGFEIDELVVVLDETGEPRYMGTITDYDDTGVSLRNVTKFKDEEGYDQVKLAISNITFPFDKWGLSRPYSEESAAYNDEINKKEKPAFVKPSSLVTEKQQNEYNKIVNTYVDTMVKPYITDDITEDTLKGMRTGLLEFVCWLSKQPNK